MTDAFEIRYSWTLHTPESQVMVLAPKLYRHHPIHGLIFLCLRWTTLAAAKALQLPYFEPCYIL